MAALILIAFAASCESEVRPTNCGRVDIARAREYLGQTFESAISADADALARVPTSHAYWLIGALHLVGGQSLARREVVVLLLDARRTEDGGFSAIPGGESSMLHTLAAVQLAALTGGIGALCVDERLLAYACAQLAEATASGCDVRATCCAILTLALLGAAPPRSSEQAVRAREALLLCRNWDGAFGGAPLAESHAGTTFCAVAALTAMGELDALSDADRTARWLADRQQPCGGFNGRPDKEPDLCYAWWCVASLALLGRTHWIDARAALRFVERCASVDGGLAFAPAQLSDPYHTFFGLAARRVLDESQALLDESQAPGASPSIEWAYALPTAVVPQACRLGPSADA